MEKIKFSAEKFKKDGKIEVRFCLRGPVLNAGLKDAVVAAGFELAEDISNTYYAWARNPDEAATIQNVIKPMMLAGKVSV